MYLVNKIKNIVRWAPVIWKDEDWDSFYFLTIMEKKLTHMIKHSKSNQVYVGQEDDRVDMEEALKYLSRVIKDDYYLTSKTWQEEIEKRENDWKSFINILSTKLFNWWD